MGFPNNNILLPNEEVSEASFICFFDGIKNQKLITKISLFALKLGTVGASALGNSFHFTFCLKYLSISKDNSFGDSGALALGSCLFLLKHLECLVLSNLAIGAEGFKSVGNGIAGFESII